MTFLKFTKRQPRQRKVFVIGLDCAAPELVFRRWQNDLPNLISLKQRGAWGDLTSCIPAITVPAWSSMLSSRDPGALGIYGFRNRADYSYDRLSIAMSGAVTFPRVWDYLTSADKSSVVIGVPQTFPVKPLNGVMVSDFLTPNLKNEFTYPAALKAEILDIAPDYDFDVPEFRTHDKPGLLRQIYAMTEKRFRVIDHLLATRSWDFFMFVEVGVDRLQHAFWSYHDPAHVRYQPDHEYRNVIHDYYVYLDRKIGEWLHKFDEDVVVMVVSDHGARSMDGGICVNEWLWRNGYLVFKTEPQTGKIWRFHELDVDWPRTTAWGDGGYYGRIFLNVAGREPQGHVSQAAYEDVRRELAERLTAIPGPQGQNLGTRVFTPESIYRQVNGIPPDLLVYFGDLAWRSVGSMGHGGIYTFENDTGPDDCNHAQNGMAIVYDPRRPQSRQLQGAQLMDVAPTILKYLGVGLPPGLQGHALQDETE